MFGVPGVMSKKAQHVLWYFYGRSDRTCAIDMEPSVYKESMQVKSMFSSIVQVPNGCTAIV